MISTSSDGTTPTGPAYSPTTTPTTTKKWVYRFEEGSADMRDLLGGKGAGCAEMTRAGLPVPPGFTITTEACNAYYASGKRFPGGTPPQITSHPIKFGSGEWTCVVGEFDNGARMVTVARWHNGAIAEEYIWS